MALLQGVLKGRWEEAVLSAGGESAEHLERDRLCDCCRAGCAVRVPIDMDGHHLAEKRPRGIRLADRVVAGPPYLEQLRRGLALLPVLARCLEHRQDHHPVHDRDGGELRIRGVRLRRPRLARSRQYSSTWSSAR